MLTARRWIWNGFKMETVFVKVGSNTVNISFLAHKQYWAGEQIGEVSLLHDYKWDCLVLCTF